jgi:hypothetical protein
LLTARDIPRADGRAVLALESADLLARGGVENGVKEAQAATALVTGGRGYSWRLTGTTGRISSAKADVRYRTLPPVPFTRRRAQKATNLLPASCVIQQKTALRHLCGPLAEEPVPHDGIASPIGGTHMLFAVITLCAVLVGAGIVSAGCFFWLVYRGPSPDEWQSEMERRGAPRLIQDHWPPL